MTGALDRAYSALVLRIVSLDNLYNDTKKMWAYATHALVDALVDSDSVLSGRPPDGPSVTRKQPWSGRNVTFCPRAYTALLGVHSDSAATPSHN